MDGEAVLDPARRLMLECADCVRPLLRKPLFQGFINFNVTLQNVGEKLREANTFAFGLVGKIFPNTSLDRSWQEDSGIRRNMMTASCGFTEVNFHGHFFVDRFVCHWFSV